MENNMRNKLINRTYPKNLGVLQICLFCPELRQKISEYNEYAFGFLPCQAKKAKFSLTPNIFGIGSRFSQKSRPAFSLMEIILVVVIIGMLASLVMPHLMGSARKARIKTTQGQLNLFKTALVQFNLEAGRMPTTDEGLQSLIEQPTAWPTHATWEKFLDCKNIPLDPWGRDYVYRYPGSVEADSYELFSVGPDGQESTEDDIDLEN